MGFYQSKIPNDFGAFRYFGYPRGSEIHAHIKRTHAHCGFCRTVDAATFFWRVGVLAACPRCTRVMEASKKDEDALLHYERTTNVALYEALVPRARQCGGAPVDVATLVWRLLSTETPFAAKPIPPICPKPGNLPPAKMLVCGWCAGRKPHTPYWVYCSGCAPKWMPDTCAPCKFGRVTRRCFFCFV